MGFRTPRLPESILIVAGGAAVLFGAIAFGVGMSQVSEGAGGWRAVDWTWFKGCFGALAACVALRFCGLIDWIKDAELQKMADAEDEAEYEKEIVQGTLSEHRRRWQAIFIGGSVFAFSLQFFGNRIMNLDAALPGGEKGATFLGMTFGVFHVFGRTTTGSELALVAILVAVLVMMARRGFARLARANRRP